MTNLFSHLAWYNIGYIDWEPWLPEVLVSVDHFHCLEFSPRSDLHTCLGQFLVAHREPSRSFARLNTRNIEFCHVDRRNDRQRQFRSTISK